MLDYKIKVGGAEYPVRCSALTPRIYRAASGRDMVIDMMRLENALKDVRDGKAEYSAVDLETFEYLTWAMVKCADKENVPNDPDEWLDTIPGFFSIYEALPQIMAVWADSNKTTSVPAKKAE